MNNYIQSKCSNTRVNGKDLLDTVKPLISHTSLSKNDKIILMNGDYVVSEPNEVVSCFNNYFTNMAMNIGPNETVRVHDDVLTCMVGYNDHESIEKIKQNINMENHDEFEFRNIDVMTVKCHLQKLNSKKTTGYDILPSKLLKLGCDILCYPLCNLLNMSIKMCKFPNALKFA